MNTPCLRASKAIRESSRPSFEVDLEPLGSSPSKIGLRTHKFANFVLGKPKAPLRAK